MTDELFFANGVNASTGAYGFTPKTEAELVAAVTGESLLPESEKSYLAAKDRQARLRAAKAELARLRALADPPPAAQAQIERLTDQIEQLDHLGVAAHVEATDLAQAGWGVIFPADSDPAIREALTELLAFRQAQAGDYFRIFADEDGYHPDDTYLNFLARYGVGPGQQVDPKKGVPYYLLLVGDPDAIPYRFQYQLDVQYAVGRIYFDSPDDYARYARSLVLAEKGEVRVPRQALFFGVENPHDRATRMSTRHLIKPLHQTFAAKELGWQTTLVAGEDASKQQLTTLLHADSPPTLLFTASHGVEFLPDDPRQRPHQGALLCSDWAGPEDHVGPLEPALYFAGDDVSSTTNLLGMITFHFACYGAGTPRFDEFAGLQKQRKAIAPQPFLAALPQRLLAQGALAVVGHVERAWGHSFFSVDAGTGQTTTFESTLERLLRGEPVGLALEDFNERYATLATLVNEELRDEWKVDRSGLPGQWMACADARNYVVIGDPAARLPLVEVDDSPAAVQRPLIEVAPVSGEAEPSPAFSVPTNQPDQPAAKPLASLSDADWQATPPAVQRALSDAVTLLRKIKSLADWEDVSY